MQLSIFRCKASEINSKFLYYSVNYIIHSKRELKYIFSGKRKYQVGYFFLKINTNTKMMASEQRIRASHGQQYHAALPSSRQQKRHSIFRVGFDILNHQFRTQHYDALT